MTPWDDGPKDLQDAYGWDGNVGTPTWGDRGQFERDHAPGNRVLTASRWPSLVVPAEHRPAWMPSPLALALHMTGEAPIEATGAHLRMGHLMEPVGERVLAEDHGIIVETRQPRFCDGFPSLCYPDGVTIDGDLVEFKTIMGGESGYKERWSAGVPLHIRAQVAAQMLISGLRRAYVVPIIIGYGIRVEVHLVEHDAEVEGVLLDAGRDFLAMVDRGDLPAPDATPSSYEALCRTMQIKPEKRVALDDDFLEVNVTTWSARAQTWRQATADRLAAEKVEDAQRLAFASVAGDAGIIELSDGSTIKRKSVTRKAVPNPKPQLASEYWRWSP